MEQISPGVTERIFFEFMQKQQKHDFRFFRLYGFWRNDRKNIIQANAHLHFKTFDFGFDGTNQAYGYKEKWGWMGKEIPVFWFFRTNRFPMREIALTFFQSFSLPQFKGFDWIEILLDRIELLVILDNRVEKEKKKSIQHLLGVPLYRDSEAKCKINGFSFEEWML